MEEFDLYDIWVAPEEQLDEVLLTYGIPNISNVTDKRLKVAKLYYDLNVLKVDQVRYFLFSDRFDNIVNKLKHKTYRFPSEQLEDFLDTFDKTYMSKDAYERLKRDRLKKKQEKDEMMRLQNEIRRLEIEEQNKAYEDALLEEELRLIQEQERIEQERIEQERIEQERIEQELKDQERIEQERIEQERKERDFFNNMTREQRREYERQKRLAAFSKN